MSALPLQLVVCALAMSTSIAVDATLEQGLLIGLVAFVINVILGVAAE